VPRRDVLARRKNSRRRRSAAALFFSLVALRERRELERIEPSGTSGRVSGGRIENPRFSSLAEFDEFDETAF
jgi:hypothetical protein